MQKILVFSKGRAVVHVHHTNSSSLKGFFSSTSPETSRRNSRATTTYTHGYLTELYGRAERTPSERAFSSTLFANGHCSFYMGMLFFFLTWIYILNGVYTEFLAQNNPVEVRCLIPELEPYFNFTQIVHLIETRRDECEDLQHCYYDNWNYTALLTQHNYNYDLILEHILHSPRVPEQLPCRQLVARSTRFLKYTVRGAYDETITENNLVCEDPLLVRVSTLLPEYICLVLSIPSGIIGDLYGRKVILVSGMILRCLGAMIMWLPSIYCILLGQVISGSAEVIGKISLFIIEMCNVKSRIHFGFLPIVASSTDDIWLSLLYHTVPSWRHDLTIVLICMTFNFFIIWYVDESPRWLFYTGRVDKAWKILCNNYKGVKMPSLALMKQDNQPTKFKDIFKFFGKPIFKSRILVTTLLMFFLRAQSTITDFHPVQNAKLAVVSYYLLVGISEGACFLICYVMLNFFTRKTTLLTFIVVACFVSITIFMNKSVQSQNMTVYTIIVKALSRTGCLLFYFTVLEMYPTRYRYSAVGCTIFSLKVADIFQHHYETQLSPKVLNFAYIPVIGFGTSAWLLSYFLLETASKDLPDLEREALQYIRTDDASNISSGVSQR